MSHLDREIPFATIHCGMHWQEAGEIHAVYQILNADRYSVFEMKVEGGNPRLETIRCEERLEPSRKYLANLIQRRASIDFPKLPPIAE